MMFLKELLYAIEIVNVCAETQYYHFSSRQPRWIARAGLSHCVLGFTMSLEWMINHVLINSFLKLGPRSTTVKASTMGALNNRSSRFNRLGILETLFLCTREASDIGFGSVLLSIHILSVQISCSISNNNLLSIKKMLSSCCHWRCSAGCARARLSVSIAAADDTDVSRVEHKYNNNGYSFTNNRTIVNFIVHKVLLHILRPWNSARRVIKTFSLL